MIFEINLLKNRAKLKRRKSFLRIVLYSEIFLFLLTYLLLFSYYVNLSYKVKDKERDFTVLNEDIIFLSGEGKTLSSIKEINEKYSEITSQLNTINGLVQKRMFVSHKLKGLSNVLPDDIWIDRFDIAKGQGKDGKREVEVINLDGYVIASKEEAFGKVQSLIKDLENEPLFSKNLDSIELVSISKSGMQNLDEMMEFEISCQILKE